MIDFTPSDEEVVEGYEKLLAVYVKLPLIIAVLVALTIFVMGIVETEPIVILISPVVGVISYWLNKITLVPMILPICYLKKIAEMKTSEEEKKN